MTDDALLAGLGSGSPDVGLAFVRRFQRQVFGVALAVLALPAIIRGDLRMHSQSHCSADQQCDK